MCPVDPDDPEYPYDIKLTNGATVVEAKMCNARGTRSLLGSFRPKPQNATIQTRTGPQKYSDQVPPWTDTAQTDWSGGRGGIDFDRDTTKYNDGLRVDTTKAGQVIPAGQYIYMKGYRNANMQWDYANRTETRDLVTNENYYAVKFTPTADFATSVNVYFIAQTATQIKVSIYSDDGGTPSKPDTLIAETTTTVKGDSIHVFEEYKVAISLGAATLSSGTAYWLRFYALNTSLFTHYSNTGQCSKSADGTNWTNLPNGTIPYYQITTADADFTPIFCEYKGILFMAVKYANSGTYSKIFANGDHGAADASAAGTLVDATKSWTADEWIGCQVKITGGTGFDQEQNWRYISDNDATSLTVTPNWDVIPDTTTTYVIKRSKKWTENLFDTHYNSVVTDMLAVNGALYVACGDSQILRRYVAYNNAGTWTTAWSDYDTYTAGGDAETGAFTYLKYGIDHANVSGIWGAKSGLPAQIAFAPAQDWSSGSGSVLTFETAINVGDTYERITGLENYSSPYDGLTRLHILKEGSIYHNFPASSADVPQKYFINQMGNTKDGRNGLAHWVQDVYLYISWHNTLLRYYNGQLDRVGPDKADDPLPYDRKGNVSAIAGTSGMLFIAVDAGEDGYSCIMANSGYGWTEMYRAPNTGDRIRSLYVESIDGNMPDRLLFGCGSDVLWLPISEDPFNHPNGTYDYYMFCYQGSYITGYFYNGMNEIEKLLNSIRALMYKRTYWSGGGLYTYHGLVYIFYRTDETTNWTYLDYVDSNHKEMKLSSTYSVSGRRIQFRFVLSTNQLATWMCSQIVATVLESLSRVPTKPYYTVMVRLEEDGIDGTYTTGLAKYNALTGLQELATACLVESKVDMLDGKYALIENLQSMMIEEGKRTKKPVYIGMFDLVVVS